MAIFRGPERACAERALVLSALSIPWSELRDGGDRALVVPAEHAPHALFELERYERENKSWPPVEEPFRPLGSGSLGALSAAVLLALVQGLSRAGAFGFDWIGAGAARAERLRDGEAWRAVTALTLHSDPAHLAGNAVFGGLFGTLLALSVGHGRAWLSIVAAGALGNWTNAWLRPVEGSSIGASTAVFGALGLLASVEWRRRGRQRGDRFRRAAPILGAVALFGWMGVGDLNTDIGAHVLGLLAGFALGLPLVRGGAVPLLSSAAERALRIAAPLAVATAWALALLASSPW